MNPIVVAKQERVPGGGERTRHFYWCPGCDALHSVVIRPETNDKGAGWQFEGTLENPTYHPSQLTRYGGVKNERVCHTFIKGGMIQFLDDCTHALKGQTVPLPPVPDWLVKEPEA